MIKSVAVLILLVVSQCNSQRGYCRHPSGGVIPVGEDAPLPGCKLGVCEEDGLHSIPCPSAYTKDPKCVIIPGDENMNYPICCPKVDCF
ncbi:unnamed protein product [Tenebrio molitor]|nr:unnamed protein product [Tenebrio molitor]